MKFAIVVHHDPGSAYGVTMPDLPGCFSAGDTFDAALDNTAEAIELHLEGLLEEGLDIPRASTIERHLENPELAGALGALLTSILFPILATLKKSM